MGGKHMTPDGIFAALCRIAPNVRFSTSKEVDPYYTWDGDGPDPVERGLYPHDVLFTCCVIVDGELKEAVASLGGSYFELDEEVGDAHGYLLDKLEEAALELMGELDSQLRLWTQLDDAVRFLKEQSRREYAERMFTTKNGLLYRDGKMLDCQDADAAARDAGFVYAEQLVKHLKGLAKG
jgi:hypothetical protein